VENISVGGLALVTERQLDLHARMTVSFTFPGDELPTQVEIEVVELVRQVTREFVAHCGFVLLPPNVRSTVDDWTQARGTL
jgi:hypothetical protein